MDYNSTPIVLAMIAIMFGLLLLGGSLEGANERGCGISCLDEHGGGVHPCK